MKDVYLPIHRRFYIRPGHWVRLIVGVILGTVFIMQEVARHTATETARLALEELQRARQALCDSRTRYDTDMAALIAIFQGVAKEFAQTGAWAKARAEEYVTIMIRGGQCGHSGRR